MDIARAITLAREAKGWSKNRLAKEVGVSRQTVGAWEKGDAAPSRARAPIVAFKLDIPLATIAGDPRNINVAILQPDGLNRRRVPIINWIDAGRGAQVASARYAFDGTQDYIESTYPASVNSFALEVVGDSMEPDFKAGEVIIIDPTVAPIANSFVVAELLPAGTEQGEGDCTFKQYRPREVRDGRQVFDLVPLNSEYQTITVNTANPGRIIGTLVEHRRHFPR